MESMLYNYNLTIELQWKILTSYERENQKITIEFWIQVYAYKKNAVNENPFKELFDFVLKFLILPFSNAEIFSGMNILRTKIRNRMTLSTMNSLR